MHKAPTNRCGYSWPDDYEVGDNPKHQYCYFRKVLPDTDRCAWHADPEDTNQGSFANIQRTILVGDGVKPTLRTLKASLRPTNALAGVRCRPSTSQRVSRGVRSPTLIPPLSLPGRRSGRRARSS